MSWMKYRNKISEKKNKSCKYLIVSCMCSNLLRRFILGGFFVQSFVIKNSAYIIYFFFISISFPIYFCLFFRIQYHYPYFQQSDIVCTYRYQRLNKIKNKNSLPIWIKSSIKCKTNEMHAYNCTKVFCLFQYCNIKKYPMHTN